MRCASCQADNPPENRFCEQCGATLEARCPQCGVSVRPGARFCGACGQRLAEPQSAAPARVPVVAPPGAASPAADYQGRLVSYTPPHLAQKILTTRSALEGERRQVTILFADTAGFTALAEKLDPEDVHQILDHIVILIVATVRVVLASAVCRGE